MRNQGFIWYKVCYKKPCLLMNLNYILDCFDCLRSSIKAVNITVCIVLFYDCIRCSWFCRNELLSIIIFYHLSACRRTGWTERHHLPALCKRLACGWCQNHDKGKNNAIKSQFKIHHKKKIQEYSRFIKIKINHLHGFRKSSNHLGFSSP